MPKRVDHEERRSQIAEALVRCASARGLHAIVMRDVAEEAGISVPLIQYYFKTKEQLLHFALGYLAQRMGDRVRDRIRANGASPTPRTVIETTLAEALPTDEESRTFHLVYTSYATLALTDPTLATQPLLRDPNAMEDFLLAQLTAARDAGHTSQRLDLRAEVVGLLAMSAGLGTSVLVGQRTAEAAWDILRHHIDRVFTPDRPSAI
ncbi:TetR/AcrR family transcriptional regulator [Streptomyces silvisoli]|uniref:TetR/AcrR family transcriptional regulator n=1 Tax=Streptomyces silvisoli TaxID=3034235 RepID=A0ABT5ZWS2_9ACTN|nr:TetR/AcrR family transcriptional regulator [Streptomyces silvisoli]MDF3294267.1 TetR/AcrR family transcriptional regulator [Streptomyces silvisoli]